MMQNNWLKPDWPAPANVHAATTLRSGGVSTGPYSSLNPATHVGDDALQVKENRARIVAMLALPSEPAWLKQVHGIQVLQADQVIVEQEADASFTAQADVVCAVMTADCLPALFCSLDGQRIAAAHAGWRGLLAGILTETLTAMQTTEVMVWLGPAIGPRAFEVGAEVRAAFMHKNPACKAAFSQNRPEHYLADIYQLARIELAQAGVSAVYGGEYCTFSDADKFFSFRRDQQCGRMASLIWRD